MTSFAFNDDGSLKMPTPEELAAFDEEGSVLAYTNGTTPEGEPFYVYIAVKPSKYKEFYDACVNKQPLVFEEYGEPIVIGYEASPPPDVVKQMREQYGFDEQFLDTLTKQAQKEYGEFEEKRLNNIVTMLKEKKASENDDGNNTK